MKILLTAGTALALALAAPSPAATITYTLDGSFDGILQTPVNVGATTLTGTIIGIGDLDAAVGNTVPLSSLTLVTPGFTGSAEGGTFTIDPTTAIASFGDRFGDGPAFTGFGLLGYNGRTAIGPVGVIGLGSGSLTFVSGDFSFIFNLLNLVGQQTFAARVTTTPPPQTPVPEPATWATMLLGFGLVGATARRRRRTATA